MKLIQVTGEYGGRTEILIYGTEQFFFEEPAPEPERMILLDLTTFPPLPTPVPETDEEDSDPDITEPIEKVGQRLLDFLTERKHQQQGETDTTKTSGGASWRLVNEIPADLWRYATLEDVIEADYAESSLWMTPKYFLLTDFQALLRRHLPVVQDRLDAALSQTAREARLKEFLALREYLFRVATVTEKVPQRLRREIDAAQISIDREQVEVVRAGMGGQFSLDAWFELLKGMQSETVLKEAILELADKVARPGIPYEEVVAVLRKLRSDPRVRRLTEEQPAFWERMGRFVELPATERGATVDIADAQEETVTLNWDVVLRAKRIGPIVPERTALVLRDPETGDVTHYIRGERKLKFLAQSAPGGRIERYGCVLTMRPDEGRSRLQHLLLDVERLDTLANVDPLTAVREVAEAKGLPEDHLVFRIAEASRTDARQSRILADLLIELVAGVDADVARGLVRSRSRARGK